MRRVLPALLVCVAACSKAPIDPVVLGEPRGLEADVLQLIETKVAAVRAAPSDARTHGALALAYEANGLWDAAEESFANALVLEDSKSIWLYHRALALHEGGKADAALAALREAARELPGDPAVQQRLGQWLLDRGDLEGAAAALQKALSLRPDQPDFLSGLAAVELARKRWNEALALAQRAMRIPGSRQAALCAGKALEGLGRTGEAKPLLEAGKDAQPNWFPDELEAEYLSYRLTTRALTEDAALAVAQGNLSRAIELNEKLVRRNPQDTEALNHLGANLIEAGRFDRAAEVLAKALALAPQSYSVHLNLCTLYIRQDKLSEARAEAQRAVEVSGNLASTHYQLGRVLALQNDLEGSYRELKAAIELDDRDPRMYLSMAGTAAQLSRLDEARLWCRKAIEFDPFSVPARRLQGGLALSAGDLDEASAALAVLARVAPQDERTVALREALKKAGR